jgi:hypothetical protein
MFIAVNHSSAQYNRMEMFDIRSPLSTQEGLLDAVSMAKYNCHYEVNEMSGARESVEKDAPHFIKHDHFDMWTWNDKASDRSLIIAAI